MAEYSVRVDMFKASDLKALVHPAVVANLHAAVGRVADLSRAAWQEAVLRARLWEVERNNYAGRIEWRWEGDPSTSTKATVATDYKFAKQIEEGRPARDLKEMLSHSLKVRLSKKGKRYLIIPFRHNTPGNTAHANAMPDHVYAAAKALKPSSVTGMGGRASGTGAYDPKTRKVLVVPQAKYSWGGRLAAGMMGPNQRGRVDRFAGMVRMQDTSTKGQKKSTYLTFRTMMEGSPGWIVAPKPGLYIVRGLVEAMQPVAAQEFASAVLGGVV